MKISVVVTSYNRFQSTIDSFAQIIDNDFISEFVILDDKSTDDSYEKLCDYFKDNNKVNVYQQKENKNMSRNKRDAISKCVEPFVLIIDSDNIFDNDFIEVLKKETFDDKTIYCPDFAKPKFNFKQFSGRTFSKENIRELALDSMGNVSMNTSNYLVPKDEYLEVYFHNSEMRGTDTIWMALLWLQWGNKFKIVEGMEYEHTTPADSGFMKDLDYNMRKLAELRNKILEL